MTVGTQTQPFGKLLDYEQFIDHQLDRTRRRIKLTDVATACLILLVGFLGVLFLEVLGDHLFGMPYWLRSAILVIGMGTASVYAAWRVIVPLVMRINSLYAAKTIEVSEPAFKNSLINYLELKRHPDQLPRAVLAALESRAVNDLTQVDVEAAVNQRRMIHMVYALTGVVVVFCLYCVISPRSPLASVRRAFLADVVRPTNTQLENIKPGNNPDLAEIVAGQHVNFQVDVQGVRPDKVLLHHSSDGGRFFAIKELTPGQRMFDPWSFAMTNVQQSMDYYLTGGDAESQRYHLEVKPAPTIVAISHDLEFPAYTKLEPQTEIEGGEVEAIEGTVVTVHATTNMPAKRASINFTSQELTAAEMVVTESDPTHLTGKFTVTRSGTYQVLFRTLKDQINPSPVNYDIVAIADKEPTARFIRPAQPKVSVPANVKVDFEMAGSDDHGVKSATFYYQQGKEVPTSNDLLEGREPKTEFHVPYTLDLAPLKLEPGDKLTYWLVVRDNKEPASNRFETARQEIEITAPLEPREKKTFEDRQRQERQEQDLAAPKQPEAGAAGDNQPGAGPGNDQELKDTGKSDPTSAQPPQPAPGARNPQDGGKNSADGGDSQNGPPGKGLDQLSPEQRQKVEQIMKNWQARNGQRGQGSAPPSDGAAQPRPTGDERQGPAGARPNADRNAANGNPPRDPSAARSPQAGAQGTTGANPGQAGNSGNAADQDNQVTPGAKGSNPLSPQGANSDPPRSAAPPSGTEEPVAPGQPNPGGQTGGGNPPAASRPQDNATAGHQPAGTQSPANQSGTKGSSPHGAPGQPGQRSASTPNAAGTPQPPDGSRPGEATPSAGARPQAAGNEAPNTKQTGNNRPAGEAGQPRAAGDRTQPGGAARGTKPPEGGTQGQGQPGAGERNGEQAGTDGQPAGSGSEQAANQRNTPGRAYQQRPRGNASQRPGGPSEKGANGQQNGTGGARGSDRPTAGRNTDTNQARGEMSQTGQGQDNAANQSGAGPRGTTKPGGGQDQRGDANRSNPDPTRKGANAAADRSDAAADQQRDAANAGKSSSTDGGKAAQGNESGRAQDGTQSGRSSERGNRSGRSDDRNAGAGEKMNGGQRNANGQDNRTGQEAGKNASLPRSDGTAGRSNNAANQPPARGQAGQQADGANQPKTPDGDRGQAGARSDQASSPRGERNAMPAGNQDAANPSGGANPPGAKQTQPQPGQNPANPPGGANQPGAKQTQPQPGQNPANPSGGANQPGAKQTQSQPGQNPANPTGGANNPDGRSAQQSGASGRPGMNQPQPQQKPSSRSQGQPQAGRAGANAGEQTANQSQPPGSDEQGQSSRAPGQQDRAANPAASNPDQPGNNNPSGRPDGQPKGQPMTRDGSQSPRAPQGAREPGGERRPGEPANPQAGRDERSAPGDRTPAGAQPQDERANLDSRRDDGSRTGEGGTPKTDFPNPQSQRGAGSQAKTSTERATKSGTDSNSGSNAREEDLNPRNQRRPDDQPDLQRGSRPGADQQDRNDAASGTTPPQGQKPPKAETQSGPGGAKRESANAAKKTQDDQAAGRTTGRDAIQKTDGQRSRGARPEQQAADKNAASRQKYDQAEPKKRPDREKTAGEPENPFPPDLRERENRPPLQEQFPNSGTPTTNQAPHAAGSQAGQPTPGSGSQPPQGTAGQPGARPGEPSPAGQQPRGQEGTRGDGQQGARDRGTQGEGHEPGEPGQGPGKAGQESGQAGAGVGHEPGSGGAGSPNQGRGQGEGHPAGAGGGAGQPADRDGRPASENGPPAGTTGRAEQGSQRSSSGVGEEAGQGAPGAPGQAKGQGQGGQKGQAAGSGQPSSGRGDGQGAGRMPGGAGARSPIGGGGHVDGAGNPGIDEPTKDESQPSPPAQDPNNPFGAADVAPRGQNQSNLTLRGFSDALKDAQTARELEDATGKTKEQLEQMFTRQYEKPKLAPGRDGKEVEVKVGEQPAAPPGSNLPTVSVKSSTDKIRSRGDIPQDPTRGNLNEGNRLPPPPELADRVNGYNTRLARIRPTTRRAAESATKPANQ